MTPSQLSAAFDAVRQFATIADVSTGGTLAIQNSSFAVCNIDSSGDKTVVLPDTGFMALLHNLTGGGTITVNDTDGNAAATIDSGQSCISFRVGEATDKRWHSVILGQGAT